jgi:DNA-binding MurR/RpiR family transcriptional regulator
MTASDIGRSSQTDTASVVRFAQRLGYPGYPELASEVQAEVKRDLRRVYEPGPEEKSPTAVFRRSLIEDRNSLDYMLLHPDLLDVEPVVAVLARAPRIFVAAEGAASTLGEQFSSRLRALGFNTYLLPGDTVSRAALTVLMQPGDACLGLGFTGNARGVAVVMKVAHEQGAHTIAVAGSPTSNVARVADYVLHAPSRSVGVNYSMTAAAAVLHGLAQVLAIQMGDRTAELAMRLDHLFRRYDEVWKEPFVSVRDMLREYHQSGEGIE